MLTRDRIPPITPEGLSSTISYVLVLPDNFRISHINISDEIENLKPYAREYVEMMNSPVKEIKNAIQLLLDKQFLSSYDNWKEYYVISNIFEDYVISQLDTMCDRGRIIIADNKKIKNLFKSNRFKK